MNLKLKEFIDRSSKEDFATLLILTSSLSEGLNLSNQVVLYLKRTHPVISTTTTYEEVVTRKVTIKDKKYEISLKRKAPDRVQGVKNPYVIIGKTNDGDPLQNLKQMVKFGNEVLALLPSKDRMIFINEDEMDDPIF